LKCCGPVARKDVVKDPVAVGEVERPPVLNFVEIAKLRGGIGMELPRLRHRFMGGIATGQHLRLEYFLEKRCRRARPAAKIGNAGVSRPCPGNEGAGESDPFPGEVLLALTREAQALVELGIIIPGEGVELG